VHVLARTLRDGTFPSPSGAAPHRKPSASNIHRAADILAMTPLNRERASDHATSEEAWLADDLLRAVPGFGFLLAFGVPV